MAGSCWGVWSSLEPMTESARCVNGIDCIVDISTGAWLGKEPARGSSERDLV